GRPRSPVPGTRMVCPSSAPAELRTRIDRVRTSTPEPRHTRHGSSIRTPAPRHWGQGSEKEKNPWLRATEPVPPQVGQVTGRLGGSAPVPPQLEHAACPRTWRVVVTPV